jgi:hypothetical protein
MEEYSICWFRSSESICVISRLFIAEGIDGVETSGQDEQQQLTRNHGGLFEHQALSLKKFSRKKLLSTTFLK